MSNINWPEVYQRLALLQKQDSKAYRIASIIFLALAIVILFFLPFATIVLLTVSAYLFYNYKKTATGGVAELIELAITRKSSYFQPDIEPDVAEPKSIESPSLFIFDVMVKRIFSVQSNGITPISNRKISRLKVNKSIYEWCKPGRDYQFIIGVTGDLLGFVKEEKVELLIKHLNGKEYSATINQSIDFYNAHLCTEEKAK